MAKKPLCLMKFYSDTNFGNFVESLDFLVPGNFWAADYSKLTIQFTHDDDNLEEAKRRAHDQGADIYD